MQPYNFENMIGGIQTPAFIYHLPVLRERIKRIKEILGGHIHLCFSMKANPLLAKYLGPMVDYLEVCSPGEFLICKRYGVEPGKIILSGVNKGEKDVRAAYGYGIRTFTAESMAQASLLYEIAKQENTKLKVLLRLSSGTQFGMSAADLTETITSPMWNEYLDFIGLHYFAGTQRKKGQPVKKDLELLGRKIDEFRQEYGVDVSHVEYGPGLPVPYFVNEDFDDTLAPLKAAAEDLRKFGENIQFTVEMGRFLVAEGGVYCTKVVDKKEVEGVNYAILDGGVNHMNYYGQAMAMKTPIITQVHRKEKEGPPEPKDWCLCGSLCTTADIIARSARLERLGIGDMLLFHYAGAYSNTEGIYLFLSRPMPYVYLYEDTGNLRLVREAKETYILNMED